jgi:hypothetical protein
MSTDWFFLLTTDLQLRLVSRSLMCACEWGRACFSPDRFALKSVREQDGLPVYPISLPVFILDAFLHLLHCMELGGEAWETLPPQLVGHITLKQWRAYLREYTLVDGPNLEDDRPAKKARSTVFQKKIALRAKAIYDNVVECHPFWAKFAQGNEREIVCDYVACYGEGGAGVVHTHAIDIAGDDKHTEDTVVAHFIAGLDDTQWDDFLAAVRTHCKPGVTVYREVLVRLEEEPAQKGDAIWWPARLPDEAGCEVCSENATFVRLTFTHN